MVFASGGYITKCEPVTRDVVIGQRQGAHRDSRHATRNVPFERHAAARPTFDGRTATVIGTDITPFGIAERTTGRTITRPAGQNFRRPSDTCHFAGAPRKAAT
jgi:hypothetical protein